jgi:preprotein translocase subunit SecA
MNGEQNKEYKEKLTKIYEAIKYCDKASYAPSDDKMALKIMDLETALQSESSESKNKVDEILNEILLLTKKRTVEVQSMKRGGI